MINSLFRKWWVVLLQGILFILLSIFIFKNPEEVLAGISLWFGLIVLVTGLIGYLAWLATDKEKREVLSLVMSILTFALGLLMLLHLFATMKIISVIFGLWILVTGIHLFRNGWSLKTNNSLGWVMVIAGVVSIVFAIVMIFNLSTGATGISTLLGFQILLNGISLVLLSFAKKMVQADN